MFIFRWYQAFIDSVSALVRHFQWIYAQLPLHSTNPVEAAVFLFVNGGWVMAVIFALYALDHLWVEYLEEKWEHAQKYVLLAVDVPRTNEQSPRAVENIFSAIWGGGKPDLIEKYFKGAGASRFSFEIVSVEGHIQYYIRCRDKNRDNVEAAVYAQYPNAEIQEVEDYVDAVPHHWPNPEYDMSGAEFTLVAPDNFPLRTYPYFEHTLSGEYKDPLASVIEVMNKVGAGEQVWFQICVRTADSEWKKGSEALVAKIAGQPVKGEKHGGLLSAIVRLPFDILGAVIQEILGAKSAEAKKEDKAAKFLFTPLEKEQIEGVSIKASKLGFKSKVRVVYVASKDKFRGGARVAELGASLGGFASMNLNALKKHGGTAIKSDYPWQKHMIWYYLSFGFYRPGPIRMFYLFHTYHHRSVNHMSIPYVLSTEELASLWHFPTIEIKSPLLRKIESKRSEPPSNVPMRSAFALPSMDLPVMELKPSQIHKVQSEHGALSAHADHGKHKPKEEEKGAQEPPENLPFV